MRVLAVLACAALAACGGGAADPAPMAVPEGMVALCGSPTLFGEEIGDVGGRGACGVPGAVRVQNVNGVRLINPPRLRCTTALALDSWVTEIVQPEARAEMDADLTHLRVAAGYACRSINNRPGGSLSEHARGKAVDISEFHLSDGTVVSVLEGWRGRGRALLRAVHAGACQIFGTVLGPESDRFHQDHFHFDVKERRQAYCR